MSEIFVFDNNLPKLSESDISNSIKSVAPRGPYTIVNTGKGIIFKFYREEDTNFIFTPYAKSCFGVKKLNVSLSSHSQRERNIYISDPPGQFLNHSEEDFISDIWARHGVNIASFKIFKSAKTGRDYFIFTPINSTVTKNILKAGKIIIFGQEFPVQAKRGATQSNTSAVGTSTKQPSPLQPSPLQPLTHG